MRAGADGRRPVANTANLSVEGVRQVRALDRADHTGLEMLDGPVEDAPAISLEAVQLTILTCWAEAVAEALAASPDELNTILDDARAGAPWRRQLGVAEPSADLASALMVVSGTPTVEAMPGATDERPRGGHGHLARAVLRSKLAPLDARFVSAAGGPWRGITSDVLVAAADPGPDARPPQVISRAPAEPYTPDSAAHVKPEQATSQPRP